MKVEYLTPTMTVELLEKADVLLSSGNDSGQQENNAAKEKENIYMDAISFFGEWFFGD